MRETLTEMLVHSLDYTRPESQPESEANLIQLMTIKAVFKKWLAEVGLPEQSEILRIRQLLIILVDEP